MRELLDEIRKSAEKVCKSPLLPKEGKAQIAASYCLLEILVERIEKLEAKINDK